jgi:hypothetical protein
MSDDGLHLNGKGVTQVIVIEVISNSRRSLLK